MKKITIFFIILTMCIVPIASANIDSDISRVNNKPISNIDKIDLDPLVDVSVTVEIKEIRSLEKWDKRIFPLDKIDKFSDPDFYVKVIINGEEFVSDVWQDTRYIYDPQFSATLNVPDDEEFVNITIQLWDDNILIDRLCDISDNYGTYEEGKDIDIMYSIRSGHWIGDDYIYPVISWADPSGYGRANGCDDNSIYQNNMDCELIFDIYQNDYDNDTIPYWTETAIFHTDPEINNIGNDSDGDGVPIEWEFKWGHYFRWNWWTETYENAWFYDPFDWEDHENMDEDEDGLNNVEEYLTSQWGSDPYRKDLFIELDQMEAGPNGEPASLLPEESKELLRTAYNKQNIVYHLDDGTWVNSDSDLIPFDELTEATWGNDDDELDLIYEDYFLHGDENNWKKGIFHYGVVIYQSSIANGNAFGPDRFQISSNGMEEKVATTNLDRDIIYGSAYMHESGHTLGIWNYGVDNQNSAYPWQLDWWKFLRYKSCMNYGYMFQMVDYSDGSRGLNDFDDWGNLDLTDFDNDW